MPVQQMKTNCFVFNIWALIGNMKVINERRLISFYNGHIYKKEEEENAQNAIRGNWSRYFVMIDRLSAPIFSLWIRPDNWTYTERDPHTYIYISPFSYIHVYSSNGSRCEREEATKFQSKQRLELTCHRTFHELSSCHSCA